MYSGKGKFTTKVLKGFFTKELKGGRQVIGYRLRDVGDWRLDTGCKIQDIGCWRLRAGNQLSAIGNRKSVTGDFWAKIYIVFFINGFSAYRRQTNPGNREIR